ncbi:MAG: hypothetical protein Q4D45_11690 [Lachnospiraceae bacterium]|nr:hypothetical protein [Lachnospiraceae bacterium]
MSTKLVEEENTVYEVDEECLKAKQNDSEKTVEMDDILEGMQEKSDIEMMVGTCHPTFEKNDCQKSCNNKSNHQFCLWLILLLFCCNER